MKNPFKVGDRVKVVPQHRCFIGGLHIGTIAEVIDNFIVYLDEDIRTGALRRWDISFLESLDPIIDEIDPLYTETTEIAEIRAAFIEKEK